MKKQASSLTKQRGSMLVIAVFIITVMLLLASSMINLLSDASNSVAFEVFGNRALNAANSGAEATMQKIFPYDLSVPLVCANDNLVGASELTLDLSSQVAFSGCTVNVQCLQFVIPETGYTHYRVESTASCENGNFLTVRTVALEARER